MSRLRTTRRLRWCWLALRLVAGAIVSERLARGARAAPPVVPTPDDATSLGASISVVVPARDEAARIAPLLELLAGAPGVDEVIVVDDESTDDTASIARELGARVVSGRALPSGWAGKAWALQQGLEAASTDWVVTLDADTRPDPRLPAAAAARAAHDRLDLLTVGGRFDCPTGPSRWLHPAMLTTLVYRFGPPGVATRRPARSMSNGQCMTVRRRPFLDAGGMAPVGAHVVEDLALGRHVAAEGGRVAFLDAAALLEVRMFESFDDTLRGWGRSIALPGVEPLQRQLTDAALLLLTQVAPTLRLLRGRGDVVDVGLVALRLGTLAGTRRAYTNRGIAYWLSPLADPIAWAAVAVGVARRRTHSWRGRTYR